MKLVKCSERIEKAVASFVCDVNEMLVNYYSSHYSNLRPPVLELDEGLKYIRVWRVDEFGSRSAFCFIDKASGDILKPDSWKKPAKHARGNVLSDKNGLEGVGPHGAKYL